MRKLPAAAAALALVAAAAAVVPARAGAPPSCDWPAFGHDASHSFAQSAGCSDVTATNVETLHPSWVFHTPAAVSASPTVAGDRVFVGSWDGTFYAFAAHPAPGPVKPLWTFQVKDTNSTGFGRIVSSAAVTSVDGRQVVLFGGGATLHALDAATGTELAAVCLDPRADPAVRCKGSSADIEVESSPAVVQDHHRTLVIVGIDVHNSDKVGRTGIVALELTRRPLALVPRWKFDPENRQTYTGPDLLTTGAGTGAGCGGVWSSPAIDAASRMVFFGTASCSAPDNAGVTGWESMWGVTLDGAFRWTFHPNRDTARYDDDFGASPNVLPGGLVGEGSKDGWYYAIPVTSRGDVTPKWATHVGQSGHLTSDFAAGGVLASAATGLVNGTPAVFASTALGTPLGHPVGDNPDLDTSVAQDPSRMLSLTAFSAADGHVLWRSPVSRQAFGPPTYANGLVFVPSTVGFSLSAYQAATGVPLWTAPLDGPPSSAPAIVGKSVYVGAGTEESVGDPLAPFSGVFAFSLP